MKYQRNRKKMKMKITIKLENFYDLLEFFLILLLFFIFLRDLKICMKFRSCIYFHQEFNWHYNRLFFQLLKIYWNIRYFSVILELFVLKFFNKCNQEQRCLFFIPFHSIYTYCHFYSLKYFIEFYQIMESLQ